MMTRCDIFDSPRKPCPRTVMGCSTTLNALAAGTPSPPRLEIANPLALETAHVQGPQRIGHGTPCNPDVASLNIEALQRPVCRGWIGRSGGFVFCSNPASAASSRSVPRADHHLGTPPESRRNSRYVLRSVRQVRVHLDYVVGAPGQRPPESVHVGSSKALLCSPPNDLHPAAQLLR